MIMFLSLGPERPENLAQLCNRLLHNCRVQWFLPLLHPYPFLYRSRGKGVMTGFSDLTNPSQSTGSRSARARDVHV